ncbi:phage protease [Gordonia sp. QH-12]|uniref:phage protease n=1 Tax=Gordonia sp. QH-12 TaxID=1437876 RepID=UPI0007806E8F|nr:phage protease [Gordonia sp. QH-12]
MVEIPDAPVLATIPRVELGSVGTWDISNIAGWHPTADDFASAVAALDCPAVRRPVLKLGHSDGPGDPAIGVIDNLAVTDEGQTLVGDFVGVPSWLAAADDEGRSVIASAYPDRSGEWEHNYVCQLGHTHPFVLHAMALLGVVRPGIGTLESLYDLYAKAPQPEEKPMTSAVMTSVTIDQVRSAYYNGPAAANYALWIREMLIDPPVLIVQNDQNDSLLKVPYSVVNDEVTFGEAVPVKVEYIDESAPDPEPAADDDATVAASAPRAARFASRTESRPGRPAGTPPRPAAQADEATTEGGSSVEITNEQLAALRTALGLADDVDLDGIITAVQELAKKSEDAESDGGTPAAASTAPLPDGVVAVDAGRLATLEANSARFAEHLEDERKRHIEAKLDAAIAEGRITPANRETWRKTFEANADQAAELLASMAPNSAVPVGELGHSTEPADTTDVREDDKFKNWSL